MQGMGSSLPAAQRPSAPANAPAVAPPTPRIRLRLRTVLIVLSLSTLLLPVVSLYALRLHETTLLRHTQAELGLVATLVSTAYRGTFNRAGREARSARPAAAGAPSREGAASSQPDGGDSSAAAAMPTLRDAAARAPQLPQMDFATTPVQPPFPSGEKHGQAARAARRAGAELAPLLANAKTLTHASVRLVDRQGIVVATTEDDLGLSLASAAEVRQALRGEVASSLRHAGDQRRTALFSPIVRGTAIDAFLALPIVDGQRVIGAVTASRQPWNILDTLYNNRLLLLQAGAIFVIVAVGIALIVARTLMLPIKRLANAAGRVSRGETDRFERGRHYRVNELADLANSVETMVANLQRRAAYVRDFTRHLSHEFKTPITAAQGAVELLRDHLQDMAPDKAKRFAGNVADDIQRLDRLTTRLLELAQADMSAASGEAADALEVARCLDHPLLQVAPGTPPLVQMAPASLAAVLENLLDNAQRHGATRVEVRAEQVGAMVELTVQDDGQGISPSNRERVFDVFFTTRHDAGGTGLGLAICRSLMRGAGGDIELAPAARGTAFKLTLRAAPAAPKADA